MLFFFLFCVGYALRSYLAQIYLVKELLFAVESYIRYKNQNPPDEHILQKLLETCRQYGDEEFINSVHIEVLMQKYDPFYEHPRYPISKGISPVPYMTMYPDDIYFLDYFVFKMREILPSKKDLMDDVFIPSFHHPNVFNIDLVPMFKANNINFGGIPK